MSANNNFGFDIDELSNDSFFSDDNEIAVSKPKKTYVHWMDNNEPEADDDVNEIENDTELAL